MITIRTYIPALSTFLSDGFFLRKYIIFIQLFLFAVVTKYFRHNLPCTIYARRGGMKFSFKIWTFDDLLLLYVTFLGGEYEMNQVPSSVTTIIDLGAHWGDSAMYYALLYPNAQIYAFEPDSECYDRLLRNTRDFPNIHCKKAAVSGRTGTMTLYKTGKPQGHSLLQRKDSEGEEKIAAYTLGDLLQSVSVTYADIIKFDIEGSEAEMLKAVDDLRALSACYIGEIHEDMMSASVSDLEALFVNFNVEIREKPKKKRFILVAQEM